MSDDEQKLPERPDDFVAQDKCVHGDEAPGDRIAADQVGGDKTTAAGIQGVGIAVGTGASVQIFGDVHYYPIKLHAPLRAVFDPLIEDRRRLFGGRQAALQEIGDFIRQSQGGYLVITAPAGFGKTALLASLVSGTPQAFAYHFFTPLYGADGLSEEFFLRNVVEQMAQWHSRKEEIPVRLEELRSLYHQFIDEALEHTQVLVLDGLDEVTRWRLAPYLCRSLPENLHIIAALRDVGQDWAEEYAFPMKQVRCLALDGLSRADVARVLQAAGGQAVAFADNSGLLDQIMSAAAYQENALLGADPFYVRLLAEDAAAGWLTAENIALQPRGLEGYLDAWWQQIKEMAGERPLRDLFGTLTVALGPISRADLEALNPSLVDEWAADFFDDVLRQAQRWVVSDPQWGYALGQPRLRSYMRSHIRTGPYLERLLAYCSDWQRHKSAYALTYYAEHLAEAGQNEALYALIDRPWMQARYAQTESHSAFAADVALAIATARAEEPANLTQELRACLIYATLNTLFNNLPPEVPGALAWTGKAGRARGLASLVNIEPRRQMQVLWLDPHTLSVKGVFSAGSESQRIMAYRLVAEALLAQGQIDQARQVLLGALAEAETLEIELYAEEDSQASSWAQRTSLSALAPALFRAGEAQRVLATAAQYDPDGADLLLEIAWSLASAGEAAGALQVAHCARGVIDGTDDPATQAAGLASLAWVSARVGELPAALEATDQALRLVEAVEDAFARINMSCTLAAVLSLAGEAGRAAQVVVRALEWIGAGKDLTEIVELLAYQARSLSQAGSGQAIVAQVDRLLPEVRALPDDADREVACVRLVQALAHAGAFERAIELSCSIQNQTSRLAARYFVVTALAEVGQLEWAMALTDEPDSLPWREEMVMVVAPALVYAGRYEQALEVAESVETASVKAALLAGVAQGLARAGEQASAARLADRALAAAETIADQTDHAECLDQIIVALVQVGRCSQTLDEIYSVDSPQEKAVLLGAAARAIGELGDIQQAARLAEQALATLAAPGGSAAIPILMSKMTLLLAQAGEQEAVMRGTEQTLAMTRAFIAELRGLMAGVERVIPPVVEALAQALIQVGAPESLFDLADAFGDPALRTLAQSTAAQALALASLADEANRLAGMIEDETSRLDASQAVAQSLAQVGCIDQALVAAQALPVAFSRAAALGAIAQCMLGQEVEPSRVVGVCRQALAALEEARAEDASGEAWALWILAVALGQAGEPAMAGEAAERILALAQAQADAAQKCNALGFAAQALARSDRAEQALEVARQMLATAREIEDEEKLAGVVNTLTLTLAFVQAGREELDALLNLIVSNTEEDGSRDDALESLAQVLTQVGTSNWALQVTGMLSDDDTRAELLVNIARSLDAQQVEIIDQVVEAAQAIETLASRLRALGELAQYLFQNGFAERALLLWQEAFDGVETDSREALFELLGKGAPILAALDQGQTLEDILRAVLEVETWWK